MTTIELITAIGGGPAVTAAGVGLWKLAKMWLDARAAAAARDDAREERTEQRLWDRVDRLDQRLDDCEQRHTESEKRNEECERERKADRAKIEDLEGHVLALQDVALRNDNTGRFLIEQRTSPPPKPLDLPPPKRGE